MPGRRKCSISRAIWGDRKTVREREDESVRVRGGERGGMSGGEKKTVREREDEWVRAREREGVGGKGREGGWVRVNEGVRKGVGGKGRERGGYGSEGEWGRMSESDDSRTVHLHGIPPSHLRAFSSLKEKEGIKMQFHGNNWMKKFGPLDCDRDNNIIEWELTVALRFSGASLISSTSASNGRSATP